MKRIWLNALGAWLALFCATLAHSDALLTDVIIVDVEARALTPGQSVLIEGSSITAIVPGLAARDEIRRIDGDGGCLIPGLWDSHVHTFSSPTEPDTALPKKRKTRDARPLR